MPVFPCCRTLQARQLPGGQAIQQWVSFSLFLALLSAFRPSPKPRLTCAEPSSIGLLLEKEPTNIQAQSLNQLIDGAVAKEGYVGLALAGGAATVAGLVLTALLSGRSRR